MKKNCSASPTRWRRLSSNTRWLRGAPDAASDADRVRQFIRARRAAILADLDPEPAAWPWSLASADICWPEIGAFDLRFETTWGSSGSENPLGEGTVAFSNYQLGGEEQRFELSGAIAGFEEDDGRTNKNRASLSIISLGKDFAIDILTVSLPIDWVKSGTNLPIDMNAVRGYRLSLPSPDSFPDPV